jgi:hypothetical protein
MPKVPITVKFEVAKVQQITDLMPECGTLSDFVRAAVDRAIELEVKRRARQAEKAA